MSDPVTVTSWRNGRPWWDFSWTATADGRVGVGFTRRGAEREAIRSAREARIAAGRSASRQSRSIDL